MSVKRKTPKKIKKSLVLSCEMPILEYTEKCFKDLKPLISEEDCKLEIDKNSEDEVVGVKLTAQRNYNDCIDFQFVEKYKVHNSLEIDRLKYRYFIEPIYEKNRYFRFDYSHTISKLYPPYHINVDKNYWEKQGKKVNYHIEMNKDTQIRLDLLDMKKAVKMLLYFQKKCIHPVESEEEYVKISEGID